MKIRRDHCRTVRSLLPLHVGEDLDSRERREVDEHLQTCLSCFREFRELAVSRGFLGVLAEEPLPPNILDGFTEEVMARVAIGEKGPAAPLPKAQSPRFEWLHLATAAAVLMAVIFGLRVYDAGIEPATISQTPGREGTMIGPIPTNTPVERSSVARSGRSGLRGTEAGRLQDQTGWNESRVLPVSLSPFAPSAWNGVGLVPDVNHQPRLRPGWR